MSNNQNSNDAAAKETEQQQAQQPAAEQPKQEQQTDKKEQAQQGDAPQDEVKKEAEQAQEPEQPEDTADAELKDIKDQLDQTNSQLADLKDKYLRLSAEFDNYRKRTLKEKADLILNGGEKTIKAILPVVDDLERALQNMQKSADVEALKKGVELTYNKFMQILGQNGVKPIDTKEKPLDTDYHEAVAIIDAPKEELKGKVIDTVQTGYTLNDKVIRHAKVVVGK